MSELEISNAQFWINLVGALVGLSLLFKGYFEYQKSNQIKRAEFLEKMIVEFGAPERKLALEILEGYGHQGKNGYYLVDMKRTLRDHRTSEPITSSDEVAVRKSFDALLDFLTKLSYYTQNGLMSKKELIYFRYYLEKIRDQPEVRAYISSYFYPSDFDKLFTLLPNRK